MSANLMTLPKAELHLHVEGTLEPKTVMELAERNRIDIGFDSEDDLRAAYDFGNLQEFLDLYYKAVGTVVKPEDFHLMAMRYYEQAAAQGVVHAELFLDTSVHQARGIAYEQMMEGIALAVEDAERQFGITGGVILSIVRDRTLHEAEETLAAALKDRDRVLGIGLDSAEVGYPPSLFSDLFRMAGEAGLKRVAHAGEEGPADYIREAVELLGVDRIDHGIRIVEDQTLTSLVAERCIPLTVCPLSNVALKCVPDLRSHPLLDLLEAGLVVTINSDDPAYFGGYVGDNYAAMAKAGMSLDQAIRMARNSVVASFAEESRKAELYSRIDEWTAAG